MITKLDLSKENLLAFKLSGEIHDEGIKVFTTDLKAALEEYEKVRLYLEFEGKEIFFA
jgi:translation initiation factor IF-3